jgi:DNA-binding NarL/FixJ family response regulator
MRATSPMNILIVEDDHFQSDLLKENLKQAFPNGDVTVINTEHKFRSSISNIVQEHPPDVVVMDVMLRWHDPAPNSPDAPEEVKNEGSYRAGFRCKKLLIEAGNHVPTILYSVLEEKDVQHELHHLLEGDVYLQKGSDLDDLVQRIRDSLSNKVNLGLAGL